jgi:predicted metalloprotease with PDZ domain
MIFLRFTIKPAWFFFIYLIVFGATTVHAQKHVPVLEYTVSMPDPASRYFHVELYCSGINEADINLKMPAWMPGYYQLMHYAKAVENVVATTANKDSLAIALVNENTWRISNPGRKAFRLRYDVKADKQFVANSLLDSAHGYIIPASVFMYPEGRIHTPVTVKLNLYAKWSNIATGLEPVAGKINTYKAPDFDILYDCPILVGNLEELPSFKVNGIEHRFVAYQPGNFDKVLFMDKLKKVIESAVAVIGDIPYQQYTFIAIGPGRGGIEHMNNTTVSFNGDGLDKPGAMNRIMNFLAHEYFHHYNVKRIRPFELGPFDYDKGSKTNLLWVSEGLSVYYEYLIVKRAGIVDEETLFRNFENNINAFENDPGRSYQSLTQASYETWKDGPFGRQGEEGDRSISYYDKGPVVGLLLDLAIRNATENKRSLDDVMRLLYWQYYKKLQRGFTDAEFQQACETTAGISLNQVFEYVYTTREINYTTYLGYAGLSISSQTNTETGKKKYTIQRSTKPGSLQQDILRSLLGNH